MENKIKKENSKDFTKLTQKSGISLIVLIVTIIVIIILSVTVILTVNKNNPIESAKEAVFKEDVRAFQDELNMYIGKEYTTLQGKRDKKITATGYTKDKNNSDYDNSVYKYVESFKKKYENKLAIKEDMIAYVGTDEKERAWLLNSGVYMSKKLTVKYVDEKGDKLLDDYVTTVLDNEYSIDLPEIEGYLAFNEKLKGKITEDMEVVAEYYSICNNLAFIGLDASGNETTDETSIVAYTVSGIGECNNSKIVIPKEYRGKPVTQIKKNAFSECFNLKGVIIEENIKQIGSQAFTKCFYLENVKINSKVIPQHMFTECYKLTSVVLGENVNMINEYAFYVCSSLEKITIPENLETIKDGAFNGCGKLACVELTSDKIRLSSSYFSGCNNFREVLLGDNVSQYIFEDGVLYTRDKKNLVLYPTGKDDYSFEIPSYVEVIESFSGNNKITEINIPDSVKEIRNYSFTSCAALKKVKLNNEKLNASVFYCCSNLEDVELGSKLQSIEAFAFAGCKKLEQIKYFGTMDEWNNIKISDERWKSGNLKTIICTDGVIAL